MLKTISSLLLVTARRSHILWNAAHSLYQSHIVQKVDHSTYLHSGTQTVVDGATYDNEPATVLQALKRQLGCLRGCRRAWRCGVLCWWTLNITVRPATSLRCWREWSFGSCPAPLSFMSLTARACTLSRRERCLLAAPPHARHEYSREKQTCATHRTSSPLASSSYEILLSDASLPEASLARRSMWCLKVSSES